MDLHIQTIDLSEDLEYDNNSAEYKDDNYFVECGGYAIDCKLHLTKKIDDYLGDYSNTPEHNDYDKKVFVEINQVYKDDVEIDTSEKEKRKLEKEIAKMIEF